MVTPFEDAAFSLGVGELSGLVETKFGYHIIKVTDHEEGRIVSLDEARDGVAVYLDGQRKNEAMTEYMQELRSMRR
jgi:parvulin-like peptidyl-prolyl isomerase